MIFLQMRNCFKILYCNCSIFANLSNNIPMNDKKPKFKECSRKLICRLNEYTDFSPGVAGAKGLNKKKMSLKDLSKASNVPLSVVYKYARNETNSYNVFVAARICDALKIKPADLFEVVDVDE